MQGIRPNGFDSAKHSRGGFHVMLATDEKTMASKWGPPPVWAPRIATIEL
ncbi:hypothetical protein RE6C_02052 [Rhodopirellula europaea 6C]|uniref:Uncharacterized protein n=1 Tax=Rhodopirellula europaea 6C TaxID=1263867 RepID=M2AJA9_9BACT|nr:hypothetical protein RE6C_02052 [Rhodopirellula europaea 6C]